LIQVNAVRRGRYPCWLNPQRKFTHLPMGEYRDPTTAVKLQRMGVTAGWPDFLFVGPGQAIFWLELKRPDRAGYRIRKSRCARTWSPPAYLATSDVKDVVACGSCRRRKL
jgi:hypothetical protein